MPTSSFTGGNAGSGTNKNINNVIYVQDKGNTTFDGYITIDGNLTVNGTTTTIDSVTLTIEDPVITLAKNANLNPTASTDAGLFLQRGSTENPAVFIWNETLNQFELATVAGATSATTNFTSLTKTYSTLKAGIFSGSSATFTGVVTSNGLSLTTDGQVSIKKPTLSTTPAILLNADRTGNGQQADIIALEVERGALTNAKIKWDETNDWWDFNSDVYFSENLTIGSDDTKDLTILSETTISNNLIPVYIYVKYNATSFTDNEYFYIFSTDDNGLTREVIPIKVNFSSPKLKLDQSAGYNRYIAYSASTYNNTTPPTINGIVYLNPNKTYYFHMVSDAIDLSNLDFQIYASNSILGSAPTYWKVFDGYDVNTTNAIVTYTFVRDATWKESDVVYKAGVSGGFGFIDVSDISIPTSVSDIQAKTSLKIQKGKNAILLNSDYTGNPDVDGSDVKAIEVERDILTNSYIQWDETNDRWKAEPSFYSTAIEGGNLSSLSTITAVANITTSNANVGGRTMSCAFLNIDSYYDQGMTPLFIRGILLTEGDFKLEGLGYSSTETYTNKVLATYKKAGYDPNFKIEVENGNLTTTGQATFENNLIPVYIYVKYNSLSLGDSEYFYIFSTEDNGITRDVVRLSDLDHLSENTSAGYYRYKASAGSTYNNTTPTPTVNAIAYLDPNKTYYFNMDSTDTEYPLSGDFEVYASDSILVDEPPDGYRNIFIGFNHLTTTTANIVYSFVRDATWTNTEIVRRVDNGTVEISTMDGATTVDDIDTIPLRIHSKKDNQSTTAILLNSDETGSPTKSVQIEVERGTETNSYIKWSEASDTWEIFSDLKVLDSSSNSTLLLNDSSIFTYKPLSLNNSLFYKVQRISSTQTNIIDSDVSFVVMENGALGSAVFQPDLPDLDSDTIGGRVLNIAVKGANYVEIYPATISQYIRHGGTTYSLGNPLVLSGYSSVQLISHIVGGVKDWYVTAISNSDQIREITTSQALPIFNGMVYHCNPPAGIGLSLGTAPNGTKLTFRSISAQTTTITTANSGIEGTHNTITLNSNSEGLSIYYYGSSWWVSNMYGNVGITTV